MTEDLKCPECGTPVPATGGSSAMMTGDRPTIVHASREHTDCPKCGTPLVRVQDGGRWEPDKSR